MITDSYNEGNESKTENDSSVHTFLSRICCLFLLFTFLPYILVGLIFTISERGIIGVFLAISLAVPLFYSTFRTVICIRDKKYPKTTVLAFFTLYFAAGAFWGMTSDMGDAQLQGALYLLLGCLTAPISLALFQERTKDKEYMKHIRKINVGLFISVAVLIGQEFLGIGIGKIIFQ